jgi:5-oxoprolinase (ATP-hydrolysing) subunit A
MPEIDLNCDLGESFGAWTIGDDLGVMPHVSSVNVACGFHAGDPRTMAQTVAAAMAAGCAIGAHPGLPDRVGFGRREMRLSANELYTDTLYQIGALAAFARARGVALHHVKPHGALYHQVERSTELADALIDAVHAFSSDLVLVGLANGALLARATGRLSVKHEVFADRGYDADGRLLPRASAGALIDNPLAAASALLKRLKRGPADTVCIHGDRANAAHFAATLRGEIERGGWSVRA